MKIRRLPAGFIVPAQPVLASTPPSGRDWVHEIKHDGYRMMVRRTAHSAALQPQRKQLDRAAPRDRRRSGAD